MMLLRKKTCLVLAAMLGIGAAMPPSARAGDPKEMLKYVPQDCWGFLMLQSLETIDEKAAQLQQMGVPIPFPKVTPMMLMPLGITEEDNPLDMKSPVGIVAMDMNRFAGSGDYGQAVVAILPAKDADKLVQKLGGGEATDGVIKCKNPMGGPELFAVVRDKHVIVGQNQESVKAVAKPSEAVADALVEARTALLPKSDIYVSLSIRAVVTAYKDQILGFLQMMAAGSGGDAKDMEQLVRMATEMDALDISFRLDEAGLALAALTIPKKDSDLEKMMLDAKNSSESQLAMLPSEKYLFAVGGTGGYSEHAAKFGDQNMLGKALKSAQVQGLDEAAIKTIDAELLKMMKGLGAWAASLSSLPEGANGMFGITIALESKNPGEFVDGMRKIYETIWRVSDDEDVETIKQSIVHAKDAETVAGNKVDTITVKMENLAEMAAMDPDDLKKAQTLLGKEMVFRFGAVGDKYVVISFGGGKDRYATICQSVQTKSGNSLRQDKGIAEMSKSLPSQRTGEGYFAVDNILQAVKSAVKAVGEEDDIPSVPVIDAPIAMSTAQVGSVQRMDFVVPMKVIEAVKKMIMESMQADMKAFDEEDDGESGDEPDTDEDDGSDE